MHPKLRDTNEDDIGHHHYLFKRLTIKTQGLKNSFSFKLSTVSLRLTSKGMNSMPKLFAFSLDTWKVGTKGLSSAHLPWLFKTQIVNWESYLLIIAANFEKKSDFGSVVCSSLNSSKKSQKHLKDATCKDQNNEITRSMPSGRYHRHWQ